MHHKGTIVFYALQQEELHMCQGPLRHESVISGLRHELEGADLLFGALTFMEYVEASSRADRKRPALCRLRDLQ